MRWMILLLLIFISGCSSGISNSDVVEIVQPSIDVYCSDLETLPEVSTCPRCWSYGNQQMYDSLEYEIVENEEITTITTDIRIIYGRNTRGDYKHAEFRIDENDQVFYENIEEANCLE